MTADTARTILHAMLRTDTVPTAAKTGLFLMFVKHIFVSTMHIADTIMVTLRELLVVFNSIVKRSKSFKMIAIPPKYL